MALEAIGDPIGALSEDAERWTSRRASDSPGTCRVTGRRVIRGGYGLYIDQYNTAGVSRRHHRAVRPPAELARHPDEHGDWRRRARHLPPRHRSAAAAADAGRPAGATTRPASGSIRTTTIRSRTRRTSATRTRWRRTRRWRWTTRTSRDVAKCAARRSIRSSTAAGCWRTTSSACSATRRTSASTRILAAINKSRYDGLTFMFQRRLPRATLQAHYTLARRVLLRRLDRQPVGRWAGADLGQAARPERVGTERSGRAAPLRRDRRVRRRLRHPALARPAAGERAAVQPARPART